MQKTTKNEFTEQLKKALQVPCGFLHLLTNPSEETPKVHSLPLTPCSIQTRIHHKIFQSELPPTWKLIQDYGNKFIAGITLTDQEKVIIEKNTRLQNAAMRWHEERFNRLTASNFGRVISQKSGFDKLAHDILFSKIPSNVPSIKWGLDHESVAFKAYEVQFKELHTTLNLRKSGFYVGCQGFLGASLDGVLEDGEGNMAGILEIKCPYSAANFSVREACQKLDDFYCYIDDNKEIKLRTNHAYYYQIMGTMGITSASFCDVVIWTPKSVECITIQFEEEISAIMVSPGCNSCKIPLSTVSFLSEILPP